MLSLTKSTELPRETVYFDGVFNLLLQFTKNKKKEFHKK